MVYKITKNEDGDYIKDGERYDLLSCNVCESKEMYETGEYEIIDGQQVPVIAERVVINDGFEEFESEEKAAQHFGLTYDPLPEGEEN